MRFASVALLSLGCRAVLTVNVSGVDAGAPPEDLARSSDIMGDRSSELLDMPRPDAAIDAGSAGDSDVPLICPVGRINCGGRCVDTRSDREHCGACDRPCGEDTLLGPWACVPAPTGGVCEGDVLDFALGTSHICVVRRRGEVQCWGQNAFGQLGDGSLTTSPLPAEVRGLRGQRMRWVWAGISHTCATDESATNTYCWGENDYGQLGSGVRSAGIPALLPQRVLGAPLVRAMGLGLRHSCAIGGGGVWCWGENAYGQLGDGVGNDRYEPWVVIDSGGFGGTASVAVGHEHSCVAASNGTWCWGNDNGRLGAGTGRGSSNRPVRVQDLPDGVIQVVAGAGHSCARLLQGSSYCWGDNSRGQLGDGTNDARAVATSIRDVQNLKWIAASAAGQHTCAVDEFNRIRCWGEGGNGQIGDGNMVARSSPTRVSVPVGLEFSEVEAGAYNSCGLTSGGREIWCWGDIAPIEPTVAARGVGGNSAPTPMRLTALFVARDGGPADDAALAGDAAGDAAGDRGDDR